MRSQLLRFAIWTERNCSDAGSQRFDDTRFLRALYAKRTKVRQLPFGAAHAARPPLENPRDTHLTATGLPFYPTKSATQAFSARQLAVPAATYGAKTAGGKQSPRKVAFAQKCDMAPIVAEASSGRHWTRTSDLCGVNTAL